MSKVDAMRAMREARYAASTKRAPAAPAESASTPGPARSRSRTDAPARDAEPAAATEPGGHRNMSGRACTREAGHQAAGTKNHRYGRAPLPTLTAARATTGARRPDRTYGAQVTQPGQTPAPALAPGCLSAQPVLDAAGGVRLRPWRRADAPDLVRAYADPEISRWHARSMDLPEAEAWVDHELGRWASETGGSWAVVTGDALAGRVGVGEVSLREARASVTYWVLPEARGHGMAARALASVVDWAFRVGCHRLELEHSTANEVSCRVAVRAGFAAEGTMRSRSLHHDGWHDMHLHGRVAGEHDLRAQPVP